MPLMRKSHSLKYWLLLSVFVLSTLIGLLPANVLAAPSGSGVSYFTERANQYYAGIYLRDCLNQYRPYEIALREDGSFYNGLMMPNQSDNGDKGVDVGRFYPPVANYQLVKGGYTWEGWIACNKKTAVTGPASPGGAFDSTQVTKAINDFGYASPRDFLIALGYMAESPRTEGATTGPANNPGTTVIPYTINEYRTAENNINNILNQANRRRVAADRFFVIDSVFQANCRLNTSVTGNGDAVTFINVVKTAAGTYGTQSVPAEFPTQTSTSTTTSGQSTSSIKEADKVITTYEYGGHFGADGRTEDMSCRDLLGLRNSLADEMAKYNNRNPETAIESDLTNIAGANSLGSNALCTGGSLGWVMCPLVDVFGDIIKTTSEILDGMLFVNPIGSSDGLRQASRIFVGFANLLLVVGFLWVIFSQATSVGLSAYGIKKMLPRIIAAAILINLSYFICSLALDVTNIIGSTVGGLISTIPIDAVSVDGTRLVNTMGPFEALPIIVTGLIGVGILAVVGALAFLVPILLVAALSVLGVFLAIALRYVLVLLLVIIAPLAFAAMILPNTEQLFTKWRKLFINMLILYPVVMFMLHGSQLIGGLILMTK